MSKQYSTQHTTVGQSNREQSGGERITKKKWYTKKLNELSRKGAKNLLVVYTVNIYGNL